MKQLRLLYVEYKNGKHITLNRAGKDSSFRKEVPDEKLAAFMEQLAKDNGQKLYDGTVMLGQLLQCHYSSAGSSSGGHHFIDLSSVRESVQSLVQLTGKNTEPYHTRADDG